MKIPHRLFATLLAVAGTSIAVWTGIAYLGPRDIAGPLFGAIFTVIIIATAIVLNVSLKRELFTSIRASADIR